MRERKYSSTILYLGTSWRGVVGYTPRPLNPLPGGKSHVFLGIESWAISTVCLDAEENGKIFFLP
jgi:hypothetical protein